MPAYFEWTMAGPAGPSFTSCSAAAAVSVGPARYHPRRRVSSTS